METISYFDVAIAVLLLLLGLKGVITGFIREFFGLVGLIGGIYFGSRYAKTVGALIDENLFHIENKGAIAFIGFLVLLALIWGVMTLVGMGFSRLGKLSGFDPIDRLLGFLTGTGKIFLVLSVVFYALSNVEVVKKIIEKYTQSSLLYPLLLKTGAVIIKIEPAHISQKIMDKLSDKNMTADFNTTLH